MSFCYLTREERTIYEKRRRDRVMQESRNYRVLQGWMLVKHPDLFTEFTVFNKQLQRANPARKDLTTSPMFRNFVSAGTGTFSDYESPAFFQVDCKLITVLFFRLCDEEVPNDWATRYFYRSRTGATLTGADAHG